VWRGIALGAAAQNGAKGSSRRGGQAGKAQVPIKRCPWEALTRNAGVLFPWQQPNHTRTVAGVTSANDRDGKSAGSVV